MSELTTVARPYAESIFDLAKETNSVDAWFEALQNLSMISSDASLLEFIASPKVSDEQKIELYTSIMGDAMNEQLQNLLKMLVENKRLLALSAIAELFDELKAEYNKRIKAVVFYPKSIVAKQKDKLQTALNAKYNSEVDIHYEMDSSLIGGIKIKVGDWIIDGSVSSKLKSLNMALTH